MYRDVARAKIAEGYDRALDACQRIKCEDISVAAFQRKYGRDPALVEAWRVECKPKAELPVK
jgi:hypothetical protein